MRRAAHSAVRTGISVATPTAVASLSSASVKAILKEAVKQDLPSKILKALKGESREEYSTPNTIEIHYKYPLKGIRFDDLSLREINEAFKQSESAIRVYSANESAAFGKPLCESKIYLSPYESGELGNVGVLVLERFAFQAKRKDTTKVVDMGEDYLLSVDTPSVSSKLEKCENEPAGGQSNDRGR